MAALYFCRKLGGRQGIGLPIVSRYSLNCLEEDFSKYLRHRPEEIGLELTPGGWAAMDELLAASDLRGLPIS